MLWSWWAISGLLWVWCIGRGSCLRTLATLAEMLLVGKGKRSSLPRGEGAVPIEPRGFWQGRQMA